MLAADITGKDPIRALLQAALRKIEAEVKVECEDRSFNELDQECPSNREVCEQVKNHVNVQKTLLSHFMMQLSVQFLTCSDLKTTS